MKTTETKSAAEQGNAENETLKRGMEEKAKAFVGSCICRRLK